MYYSPKPKRFWAATFAFIGIVAAFGCGVAGAILEKQLLFFAISCTVILFSFQLLFRYCFTSYIYELEDGILYVKTGIGKKQNTVFTLDMKLAVGITQDKETKRLTSLYGEIYKKFNCCQNLFPKERCAVIYDSGKRMAVVLEGNSELADVLKNHISAFSN